MIQASPAVGLSRADIAAIRATSDRWVTAVRAGRWADAAATFTADAILRFSGAVYEGRAAIQRFHEAMPPWDKTVLHIDEIDGRGDMAFVAGHSTMVPAMVLERVTGRSYSEHLQADLFGPLGLADTLVCDDDRILPRRAQGYTLGEDGRMRNAAFLSMRTPKGGGNVCSSADSYRLMTEPGTLRDGRRIAYGLGLFEFVRAEASAGRKIHRARSTPCALPQCHASRELPYFDGGRQAVASIVTEVTFRRLIGVART